MSERGSDDGLTHLDAEGRARMVDVTDKAITERRAVAEGRPPLDADLRIDCFIQIAPCGAIWIWKENG